MRVLVTGGAGFIGSHTVDHLVAEGHEVVVVDSLAPDAHGGGPPPYLNPGARYVWSDVASPATWRGVVEEVDAVAHLASRVGLGVDLGDVVSYVRANDLGTAVLIEALHRRRFRGRLVLASSMVVYGEGAYRCPEHGAVRPGPREPERLRGGDFEPPCPRCGRPLEPEAVTEEAPLSPRSVYAATKVHQEHLGQAWSRESGGTFVALRYHNVYGPWMPRDTPYAGVASVFRSALAGGRPPRVFEDGRQLRDFVHVRDVARATALALTGDGTICAALNVATGVPRTVGQMAEALADAAGPEAARPEVTGEFRLGDVRHVFASPARAAEVLGFRAAIPFEEGMREFARNPLREAAGSGPDADGDPMVAGGP